MTRSCYKRCNESRPRSMQTECMCDTYCMFIGDCCYDYLMKCDKRALDMKSALTEQSNFYQHFKPYSSCKTNYLKKKPISYMLQVSSCPNADVDPGLKCLCEEDWAWYIPVIARGVLFRNVYCAACHGIRLQEVTIVMSVRNITCNQYDPGTEFVPFQHFFQCTCPALDIANKFQALPRFQTPCLCNDSYAIYSECDDVKFKEECNAYSAVIHHNGSKVLLIWNG